MDARDLRAGAAVKKPRLLRVPVTGKDLPAGVELVLARNVVARVQPHVHDGWCLGLVDAGLRVITTRASSCLIAPGEMFVIPPGERHQCSSPGPLGYRVLRVPAALLEALAGGVPQFPTVRLVDPVLAARFRRLPGQLLRLQDRDERLNALSAVLVALLRHAAFSAGASAGPVFGPGSARLARAEALLRAHCAKSLPLGTVAREAGLSPGHFQRVFQQATGLSPLKYQQRERVRRACALLETGHTLAEAALAVGCCDQSHLCRLFRACLGLSPTSWRGR
ncbi:AraC family ligand binding domain-containing protein [Megalodesulfovibrio paquesii]